MGKPKKKPTDVSRHKRDRYLVSFDDPNVTMSITKQDCSTEYSRFIDFSAGILMEYDEEGNIDMSQEQFRKCLEVIAMELAVFLKQGVDPKLFGTVMVNY